jgi:hypothetical protein
MFGSTTLRTIAPIALGALVLLAWAAPVLARPDAESADTAYDQASNALQAARDGSQDRFREVQQKISDAVDEVRTFKAADAFMEIRACIQEFRNLRETVSQAEHIDDVINEVAEGLGRIAERYQRIADMKGAIKRNVASQIARLDRLRVESTDETARLRGEIRQASRAIERLEAQLVHEQDQTERMKLKLSIEGKKSVIKSLEGSIEVWEKFYQAQKKLEDRVRESTKKVDLLLHVLEVNAEVYRRAAETADLRKQANEAFNQLRELAQIGQLISEMRSSWTDVNELVGQISTADFRLPEDEQPTPSGSEETRP